MKLGGQPGNRNAKRENRMFSDSLRKSIAQANNSPDKLRKITDKLVKDAGDGNLMAIKEVADRLDGKAHQSVEVSGDAEKPLITRIEKIIVDPSNPSTT
jgi:phage I-like protein